MIGLTLPQCRTAIATDLKVTIGTEVSIIEANRAVERAVNDLSRYFPLEKVHEETLDFGVENEAFTTPATASATAVVTAANGLLSGKNNGDTFTIAATARQITPPRRLTVTKTDSDSTITKLTVTVEGYDQDGNYIEENWNLKDIITSGTAYQGKLYFKRVDTVVLTLFDGGGSGDAITVGTGNAYDSFVFLASKPIKPETEEVTDSTGAYEYARDSDYIMDYTNGAIKYINEDSGIDTDEGLDDSETDITCDGDASTKIPVGKKIRIDDEIMLVTASSTTSSVTTLTVTRGYYGSTAASHSTDADIYLGGMLAGTSYLIDYTKSKLGINISSLLPIVTKITKVQYPIDTIPQDFVSFNIVGDFMYIASKKAGQSQEELSDGEHLAIWYEMMHMPPGDGSPGSYPSVLDEVVIIGAAGYALLTEAQQYEQQAATDLGTSSTGLRGVFTTLNTALTGPFALLDIALGKVATYLETNGTTDNAKDVLANITDDIDDLRTAVRTALNLTTTYLTHVSTPPSAHDYLVDGDDKIDAVNIGSRVAEVYADYARASMELYQSLMAEANIRLSNLRSYIEEAAGWTEMGQTFIAEGQARIAEINSYLAEANQWAEAVNGDLVLADRFRTEGLNRLNEFHTILRNKSEARRRTSSIPTKQPA